MLRMKLISFKDNVFENKLLLIKREFNMNSK